MKRSIRAFVMLSVCAVLPVSALPTDAQRPPASAPSPAGAASQPAPKLRLTLLEDKGLKVTDSSLGRVEYGIVDPLTSPRIERVFTFRNDTKLPLTIIRLQTSCGCESTSFLRNGKEIPRPETTPALLAPGEQAQIRLAVNLTGRQAYTKHASLWIYGKETPEALASVEIVAQIEPAVVFEPAVLQFPRSPAGLAQTVAFAVAFDPRLTMPGKTWKITSSNPAVQAQADVVGDRQEKRGEKTVVVRSYRATLAANAPVGHVSGALTFTLQDASAPPSNVAAPSVPLPFMAERNGTFTASPAALLFGSVTAGKGYKRQILLSAANVKTLQDAKITSDSRFLTVQIVEQPQATANGAALRLSVTLSDQAAAGAFTGHLLVESASGEKVSIAIIAQVEPAHP